MQKYKEIILSHIVDYCKLEKYPYQLFGKSLSILCPFCRDKSLTAQRVSNTALLYCINPECSREGKKFTLISIVKRTEKDKQNYSNEEIVEYLKVLLKVKTITPKDKDKINRLFEMYEKNNWSLVPIVKGRKFPPIEKEWQNKEHNNPREWWEWINNGLNIGINCGKSNLTILDVDQKPIPKEIKEIMGEPLIQESTKGFHLFYSYDKDLPKTRINEYKLDIETLGGYVVIAPSIIDNVPRKWLNSNEVIEIPDKLKQMLINKIGKIHKKSTLSEELREDIEMEDFNLDLIEEGERSSTLIRLGGLFRKQFNFNQTAKIIRSINKHACLPPLDNDELENTVLTSIERYTSYDDDKMAKDVLNYLNESEEADKRDIERVIIGNYKEGETKAKLDKTLAYLLREDLIQKRGRFYKKVKTLEWKTDLLSGTKSFNIKVPYFYDIAYLDWKDTIIIGAKAGIGKTHVAMNIIKQLVDQKVNNKINYINLESGSRFQRIALQLGLKEGDFNHCFCYDPTQIELENNAITIIDWLMPNQYKYTDKIIGHFTQQLDKHGGFLIIFVQIRKSNGEFFAKDLIEFFPALVVKYLYDDDDGVFGHFEICKVRESQRKKRLGSIPCKFDWESKILSRIDKLDKIEIPQEKEQVLSDGKEEEVEKKTSTKKSKKVAKGDKPETQENTKNKLKEYYSE